MHLKRVKKAVSIALILCLLSQTFTIISTAQTTDTTSADTSSSTTSATRKLPEQKIVGEIVDKRESNVKHFKMSDGSYIAVEYPSDVHYKQNGKWENIDNSLVDTDGVGINSTTETSSSVEATSSAESSSSTASSEMSSLSGTTSSEMSSGTASSSVESNAVNSSESNVSNTDENSTTEDYIKSGYENKSNDFKVKFAKNTNNNIVRVKTGDYKLAWGIDSNDTAANRNDAVKITTSSNLSNSNLTEFQKNNSSFLNLKNIESGCEYSNVYPGVDFDYTLCSKSIKENIVLNNSSCQTQFNFTYMLDKLDMRYADNGSIEIYDPSQPKDVIYTIPKAVMFDATGNQSGNVGLCFVKNKNTYTVTVTADKSWIYSTDRKFPVTIDPAIESSSNNTQDAFVSSGAPSTSYGSNTYLTVGNDTSLGICRAYLKFNFPTLNNTDTITSAELSLDQFSYSPSSFSNFEVDAHKVNDTFDTSTLTYNNQPLFDSSVIDYSMSNSAAGSQSWDITEIAKDWYVTGKNTGLVLTAHNEYPSTNIKVNYYSNNWGGSSSGLPSLIVSYVNNIGLEDYWTYHTQDAGRAGKGYVNDYTGNVVVDETDLSENGNVMPLTLRHVFNNNNTVSNDTYNGYAVKTGNGWKLSAVQKISPSNISGYPYFLVDEDATKHYFTNIDQPSGTYVDEDGLSLTMTIPATDNEHYYQISSKDGTTKTFDVWGYLRKETNINGDSITYNYSAIPNVDNYLTSIVDGSGRTTQLIYDSNHVLTDIVDPSGRDTSYHYDSSYHLTSIQYPDGKTVSYSYDSSNRITTITNIDSSTVDYGYDIAGGDNPGGRVTSITKKGTDGTTQGKSYTVEYSETNITKFTDKDSNGNSRTNIYHYDNLGRTVDVTDNNGNAEYSGFTDTDLNSKSPSNNATKNTNSFNSNMQSTIINLLKNHSFELSTDWSAKNSGTVNGSAGYTTTYKNIGAQSYKITKNDTSTARIAEAQQINATAGGTFTYSGYMKTDSVTQYNNYGAELYISYDDAQGSHIIEGPTVTGTNDWKRYSFTFNLPANQNAYVCFGMTYGSGTAYFDNLQLEQNATENRYNLVENQSFESSSSGVPTNWTGSGLTGSDAVSSSGGEFGNNVFSVQGSATTAKTLSQTIKITGSGTTSDSFVIGGWAKGNSVPISDSTLNRNFDIKAQINYNDGNNDTVVYVKFNPSDQEWQYASGNIITDKRAYSSITLTIEYNGNANNALFDGIQLYKEEFGPSYTYDASGNVVSTKDTASQSSQYSYSSSNDLTSSTDPNGNTNDYYYDAKHNLISSYNQSNVNSYYQYDSHGNQINTGVVGKNTDTAIQDGQIYYIRSNNSKLYLDVYGNADSDNAAVYQHGFNGGLNQQFKAVSNGDGTYKFIAMNSASGRALAAQGSSASDNTSIVIYQNDGDTGESWKPVANSDGSFTLESKCSSYASCIDDYAFGTAYAPLVQHSVNGGMNQEWTLEKAGDAQPEASAATAVTSGQDYYVKAVNSNLYMQSTNEGTASGTGVVQNYFTGKSSQQWVVSMNSNGTYKLVNTNSSLLLTVPGGQNANSIAFDLEAQGAGTAQQYTFTSNGDGTFRILTQVSSNTKCLNVKGASTSPGAVIQQYDYNGGSNEKFVLYPISDTTSVTSGQEYYVRSKLSNLYLEPNDTDPNSGLEQETFDGQTSQRWKIVQNSSNNYKLLNVNSNLALDVPKAQNADSVALQTYGDNQTLAQQWNILYNKDDGTFKILSNCSIGTKGMEVEGASKSTGAVIQQNTYSGGDNQKWILVPAQENNADNSSTTAYTSDGNYISSTTDSSGNTVSNDYGTEGTSEYNKGLLRSTTDANGNTTSCGYDENTDNLTSVSATVDGSNVSNSYDYTNDNLDTITHNGFNYTFNYDTLGNTSSIYAGSQKLVGYNYGNNTGNLLETDYGNSQKTSYAYDNLDRVTSQSYNGTDRYDFTYDALGNLGVVTDKVNNNSYRYTYDSANRVTDITGSNGHSAIYSYDNNGKVNNLIQKLNSTQYTTSMYFNGDGLLTQLSEGLNDLFKAGYDSLGRVSSKQFSYKSGSTYNTFSENYSYTNGTSGKTTSLVSQLNFVVNGTPSSNRSLGYTYYANGNIKTISEGGVLKVTYYYNQLNEMTREDNVWQNKTITYAYDAGGNITSKAEYPCTTGTLGTATAVHSYNYGDSNWKDKLTSYDGKAITYDAIGNPLTYNGWNYTWEEGRQLAGISNGTTTDSYKYNSDGIRTQKTVNGVTTTYYLENNQVSWQTDGTNTIHYVYDTDGNLVYMLLNGTIYYYERNAQSDIIGLVDSNMNEVVTYSYDTWGKLLSIGGSLASTVGTVNPFRYRGYMYDTETGLYYLQSRYYDPNMGRFINADDTGVLTADNALLTSNLFGYCNNNPVMNVDPNGYFYKKVKITRFGSYFTVSGSISPHIHWYSAYITLKLAFTIYLSPLDRGDAMTLLTIIYGAIGGAIGTFVGSIVGGGFGSAIGACLGAIIGGIFGYSIVRSGTRRDGSYYISHSFKHTFYFW